MFFLALAEIRPGALNADGPAQIAIAAPDAQLVHGCLVETHLMLS